MRQIIIRGVSDNLHREFKTFCAAENISMTAKIIKLMEKEVENKGLRK